MTLKEGYELFGGEKEGAISWLAEELAGLRTGRVTPELIKNIPVEHYGARTPLKGLATVSNTDARTLTITAWDQGAVNAIETALSEAQIGATSNADGNVVRLIFPSLTEETREQTVKLLNKKSEEAKVKLRQGRDEVLKIFKEAKESGELTEDDFYEGKEELDRLIDSANSEIESMVIKREEDIRVI